MTIPEHKIRKSIVFPKELLERIYIQAEKEYRNISGLICIAVEEYLSRHEEKEN